jgi:hypothetical protein
MLRLKQVMLSFVTIFLLLGCFSDNEAPQKKRVTPDKITFLFVTQPDCPACDYLEKSMNRKKPKSLLDKYFDVKKLYYGEKLPAGITPPNGTPTVYFLGSNDEILVEPMVGQRDEEGLLEYLNDALLEFKNTYHVDLEKKRDENETTKISTI